MPGPNIHGKGEPQSPKWVIRDPKTTKLVNDDGNLTADVSMAKNFGTHTEAKDEAAVVTEQQGPLKPYEATRWVWVRRGRRTKSFVLL